MNRPLKSCPAHPSGTQPHSTSSHCSKPCQNVLIPKSLTLPAVNTGLLSTNLPELLIFSACLVMSLTLSSFFSLPVRTSLLFPLSICCHLFLVRPLNALRLVHAIFSLSTSIIYISIMELVVFASLMLLLLLPYWGLSSPSLMLPLFKNYSNFFSCHLQPHMPTLTCVCTIWPWVLTTPIALYFLYSLCCVSKPSCTN